MIVLDRRVDRGRRDADAVADRHVEAALTLLGIGDRAEGHGEGHEAVDGVARVAAEGRRSAARAKHLDVSCPVAGQCHAILQDFRYLLAAERDRHTQPLQPAEETFDMQIQAEETAIPDMNGVVGGVGMQETPVQH